MCYSLGNDVINFKNVKITSKVVRNIKHKARHNKSIFLVAANGDGVVENGEKPIDNILYKVSDFDE